MTDQVFKANVHGPATHALVIGVGHYPHLPGGASRNKFPNPDGMGQLKSPPASARAFARWLIEEYKSPQRPLASVTLLSSEKTPEKFEYKKAGGAKASAQPPAAAMPVVVKAIREWKELGDKNPAHLLLFYFCGHGISAGTELSLLMEDFGADEQAPLDGALDFRRFQSNMEGCAARNQCYFVDACRVGSELLERNDGFAGNPVIHWSGEKSNPGGLTRLGPIFHATLAKAPAYAKPGKVSVFTDALLEALRGAGSGDETGPWEVKPSRVQTALGQIMREMSQILGMPMEQIPAGNEVADFTLNTLDTPQVPVFVRVEPKEAHQLAQLRLEGPVKMKRAPQPQTWKLTVAAGKYSFYADFKSSAYKAAILQDETVRPPFWGKPLKAKP
jgi:hypothetical protein